MFLLLSIETVRYWYFIISAHRMNGTGGTFEIHLQNISDTRNRRQRRKHNILGGALFTYTHLAYLKFQMDFYFGRNEFFNYFGLLLILPFLWVFSLKFNQNDQLKRVREQENVRVKLLRFPKQKNNKIAASFCCCFVEK